MGLFVREKLIYKERGKKEEWKRAQALLKEAGLKLSVAELPGEAPSAAAEPSLISGILVPKARSTAISTISMCLKKTMKRQGPC